MSKRSLLFPLFLFFSLACGALPASAPTPTSQPDSSPKPKPTPSASPTAEPLSPVCRPSAEPTAEDIDRALTFTGSVFSSSEWKRSYTVMESRVAVSWMSENALAYLEALIFPCGYEDANLDAYYSPENWAIIFSDYDSYQPAETCRSDSGLRLHQFSAQNSNVEYEIRYWAQNDSDERVLSLMLTFPVEERAQLEEYAARLFPNLPRCP